MADRRYLNGRQVDADGRDLLTGKDPWTLPHGCSWSSLETFARSRKTYLRKHHLGEIDTPTTPAMEFGRLAHLAILEPDRYEAETIAAPKVDRRYKEGKEAWADFLASSEGRTPVKPDDHEKICAMRDAVRSHEIARVLLAKPGIEFERETQWQHPSGLDVFAHPDAVFPGGCFDLKTTRDVRPDAFAASAERYGYARQAALYLIHAHTAIHGQPGERFYWICCDSTEPYDVECFEVDPVWIDDGAREADALIWKLAKCVNEGDWRSTGERLGGAIVLERPPWAAGKALAYEE